MTDKYDARNFIELKVMMNEGDYKAPIIGRLFYSKISGGIGTTPYNALHAKPCPIADQIKWSIERVGAASTKPHVTPGEMSREDTRIDDL